MKIIKRITSPSTIDLSKRYAIVNYSNGCLFVFYSNESDYSYEPDQQNLMRDENGDLYSPMPEGIRLYYIANKMTTGFGSDYLLCDEPCSHLENPWSDSCAYIFEIGAFDTFTGRTLIDLFSRYYAEDADDFDLPDDYDCLGAVLRDNQEKTYEVTF